MHVVSVCLHFVNIIWLPWQRTLTNLLIKVQIYHLHIMRSQKIAKTSPVYPEIFDEIRQFFDHVIPDVHK